MGTVSSTRPTPVPPSINFSASTWSMINTSNTDSHPSNTTLSSILSLSHSVAQESLNKSLTHPPSPSHLSTLSTPAPSPSPTPMPSFLSSSATIATTSPAPSTWNGTSDAVDTSSSSSIMMNTSAAPSSTVDISSSSSSSALANKGVDAAAISSAGSDSSSSSSSSAFVGGVDLSLPSNAGSDSASSSSSSSSSSSAFANSTVDASTSSIAGSPSSSSAFANSSVDASTSSIAGPPSSSSAFVGGVDLSLISNSANTSSFSSSSTIANFEDSSHSAVAPSETSNTFQLSTSGSLLHIGRQTAFHAASPSLSCKHGDIRWGPDTEAGTVLGYFIWVCVSHNLWMRAPLEPY